MMAPAARLRKMVEGISSMPMRATTTVIPLKKTARLAVARRQSNPRGAREWIGIRCSLATQVRQKYQPITSRRRRSSFFNELGETLIARELIAIPLQTAGRAQHHSHQMPAPCDSMTKRVQPSLRLDQWRLSRSKNHS